MNMFLSSFLKFFFLLTPFFVLSMFLSMTQDWDESNKKRLALKIAFSAICVSVVLFFFGNWIFHAFGITLDSFRIGGGALLFLSAVKLVNGAAESAAKAMSENADIAVVPLAIPVTVGPATTGGLLIMGAETGNPTQKMWTCLALLLALVILGFILYCGSFIERMLKRRGITILSKITGLILSALASQMIFTGICNFLRDILPAV